VKQSIIPPQGAEHRRNWAAQLLTEHGHEIGGQQISSDGTASTLVDNLFLTNPEIIAKAATYPEWRERERLMLRYWNKHQALL